MRVDLIIAKLEQIQKNIELIQQHLPSSFKAFQELGLLKDGIYKRVEYSAELLLDICAIINSDLQLGIPNDEGDILTNLEKKGIISSELLETIRGIKSFRNIVVHKYGTIDDEIAFSLLDKRLDDFHLFTSTIKEIIRNHTNKKD
jgi:uncharacterized protein YutE (UPF0331/DUF86 family)